MPPTPRHIDDIEPVLNPALAADLEQVLRLTPYARRVDVALAFANVKSAILADLSGMDRVSVFRWLERRNKMPFGAACRLSKVLGVDAMTLFWYYMDDLGAGPNQDGGVQ
jgi:hypothetical protein